LCLVYIYIMAENQPIPINNSLHLTFHIAGENSGIDRFTFVPSDITGCLNEDNISIKSDCIVLYYLNENQSRIINYQLISDLYGWGRGDPSTGALVNNRTYDEFKKANLMVNFLDVIKDGNGIIKPNDLSDLGMYNNDLIGPPRLNLNETYIKGIRDNWEQELMLHAYNLGLLNHFSLDKVQGTSSHLTSVGPKADYLALDAGKRIGSPNGDTSSRSPLFSTWARWADPSSSGNAMDSDTGPHKYISEKYISENLATEDVFNGIDISNLSVTIDENYYKAMGHGDTFKRHGPPKPYELTGTNRDLWKYTKYLWKMDLFPEEHPTHRDFATLSSDVPNGDPVTQEKRDSMHKQTTWKKPENDSVEDMSIESFYGGNQEKALAWSLKSSDTNAPTGNQKKKLIIVKLHGDGGQRDELVIANLLMKKKNHDIAGCTCDNVHMCCLYGVNVGCIYTGEAKTMFPEVFKKQKHRQRVVQFTPEKDPVLSFFKERDYTLFKMCEHNYNICRQLQQIINRLETGVEVRVFLGKCQQQEKEQNKGAFYLGALKYFKGMLYDCNIYILNILYELFGPETLWTIPATNNRWISGVSQIPSLSSFNRDDGLQQFKAHCSIDLDSITGRIPDPWNNPHFSWLQHKDQLSDYDHGISDGILLSQASSPEATSQEIKTGWKKPGESLDIRKELDTARKKLIQCKRLNYVTEVFFWDSAIFTVIINGGAKFTPGSKTSFKPGMAHAFEAGAGILKGSFQHIFQTKAGEIADDGWNGIWSPPEKGGGGILMGGSDGKEEKFPPYDTPWGNDFTELLRSLESDPQSAQSDVTAFSRNDYINPLKFMYMKEFSITKDKRLTQHNIVDEFADYLDQDMYTGEDEGNIVWAPLNIILNRDGVDNSIDLNHVILERLRSLVGNYKQQLNEILNGQDDDNPCSEKFSDHVVLKSLVDLYLAECYTNESQGIPGIEIPDIEIVPPQLKQLQDDWFDAFIDNLFVNEYYSDDIQLEKLNQIQLKQLNEIEVEIDALEVQIQVQIDSEKAAAAAAAAPPSSPAAFKSSEDNAPSTPAAFKSSEDNAPSSPAAFKSSEYNAPSTPAGSQPESSGPLYAPPTQGTTFTSEAEAPIAIEKQPQVIFLPPSAPADTAQAEAPIAIEKQPQVIFLPPSAPADTAQAEAAQATSAQATSAQATSAQATGNDPPADKRLKLDLGPDSSEPGKSGMDDSPDPGGGSKKKKTRRRNKKKKTKRRRSKNKTKTRSNRRKKRSKGKKRRKNRRT
jgi:hypothetical protein